MIAITKSWPLFTIFIVIFAFSFSFIGSEFQSLVITVPESGTESWYLVITFSFVNPEYRSLVILHFFFRPLWKSAVFRAGNVVGFGCHIFPLRLQIAFSGNVHMSLSLISSKMILTPLCSWIPAITVALNVGLFKCPILTAWMKLTGLLTIIYRFLGIFCTNNYVVTKICSVIFETRLFSYGHFFGWKTRIS